MSSLYQLTEDLIRIESLLLETANEGEVDGVLADYFDQTEGDFLGKVENYCQLIRNIEEREASRAKEAKRIAELAKHDEKAAGRLKAALKAAMERTNRLKLETARFRLTVKKNGGLLPLEFTGEVPDSFKKTKTETVVDSDAIRKALEEGKELPFAKLKERATRLEIK